MSSPKSPTGRTGAMLLVCLTFACGQDPYQDLKSENVGLGAVDPVTFPAANLGTDGNRMQPGSGTFTEVKAFAGGEEIGYFAYPVNTAAMRDPLRVKDGGKPYPYVATPTAYAFDATPEVPVPEKGKCGVPPGYKPDKRLDPAPGWYTRQNNIFTALPTATYNPGVAAATTYVPVVAEAKLSSGGRVCQDLKSEKGISNARGGKLPALSGAYLAWLVIDPAASVLGHRPEEQTLEGSIALQKWGWYNRYLVAYLDGGYIPTADVDINVGTMDMPQMATVTRMATQKLYTPRGMVKVTDPDTMMEMEVPAKRGDGYDVLAAKRGAEGYSPVCELWTYAAPMPAVNVDMLPKTVAAIEGDPTLMPMPGTAPRYVYCLQVR